MAHFYPIGEPGKPWGDAERAAWRAAAVVQRSYREEVLDKLERLSATFDVEQYGALSIDPERYPLFCAKSRSWDAALPSVLITGGVHGYETSGVQGALLFLEAEAARYAGAVNLLVCPCVSPWGYECVQRWSPTAVDPNRSFVPGAPGCEEAAAVMALVASLGARWLMHCDLHETTDTDLTEFRPAKAARDGAPLPEESIPDGFYLIADAAAPQLEWHAAMIAAVRRVTHIAPPDARGQIVELDVLADGVVSSNRAGKGKGVTDAPFVTTTEVYPDSKATPVTPEQCNRAQVAAVTAGLDYVLANAKGS